LDSERAGNDAVKGLSGADCRDIEETTNAFSGIGIIGSLELVVSTTEGAQRIQAGEMSEGVIPLLGAHLRLGRGIPAGDNRGSAVLSYGYWLTQYGGDPGAIGKTIRYNGNRAATIVGVLGPAFNLFPLLMKTEPAFYLGIPPTGDADIRGNMMWTGLARLRTTVSIAQAQRQLKVFGARQQALFPRNYRNVAFRSRLLEDVINGSWRRAFFFLNAMVFLVMAASGANTAILFLIRAHSRRHETALRVALGASPADLAGPLLAESTIVSILGVLSGLALAWAVTRMVASGALAPLHIPRLAEAAVGGPVVLYALLLIIGISAICAAAPAWTLLRSAPRPVMSGEAGGRFFRGAGAESFVLFEVFAFMLVLLVGSAFVGSYLKLVRTQVGYDFQNALAMRLTLPYTLPQQDFAGVLGGILARVSGNTGTRRASVVYPLPCLPDYDQPLDVVKGAPGVTGTHASARVERVDSGYFDVMKIPLLRGRGFHTVSAFSDESQVVVSQAMAERWLGGDGIGAVLRFPQFGPGWTFEVVGVAGNTRQNVASARPDSTIYINRGTSWMYLIVRGASLQDARTVAGIVKTTDRNIALDQIGMMDSRVDAPAAGLRVEAVTLACFAMAVLAVLVAGMYSTVSLALHDSRRRLAIKAAIGATPSQLYVAVLRPFLLIALGGILAGGIVGLVLVGLLRSWIPELDMLRLGILAVSACAALTASIGTASIAARRILLLDPSEVFRTI